jgi:hypothetical protein
MINVLRGTLADDFNNNVCGDDIIYIQNVIEPERLMDAGIDRCAIICSVVSRVIKTAKIDKYEHLEVKKLKIRRDEGWRLATSPHI